MHAWALPARGWLAGLLALASGLAFGQAANPPPEGCYAPNTYTTSGTWWRHPFSGTARPYPYASPAEAHAAGLAYVNGASTLTSTFCGINAGLSLAPYDFNDNGGCSGGTCQIQRVRVSDGQTFNCSWNMGQATDTKAVTCPVQQGCNDDIPANAIHLAVATNKPDSYVPPDSICSPGNCELIRIPNKYHRLGPPGARELMVSYQGTGNDCQTPSPETISAPDTETCVGPWCRSVDTGENCGYVNNEYTCLDRVEPDRCWRTATGALLCADNAPMPPKPDSGTPGQPATPTETIEACTGANSCQTVNYYNSAAVSASSRPVPQGTGTGGSGALDGEGPVSEEEEAAGSASGGLSCDSPPACDGSPIDCAILAQQWRTRCVENPSDATLEAELGPIEGEDGELFGSATFTAEGSFDSGGWMGAAACIPDYSLNLGAQLGTVEIPFSEWCWLLEVIGTFVMIAAYVSAARIVVQGI